MQSNQITKIQQRKPRYRRVPKASCRLQERDKEIIKLVHKHRFLTSEHITALVSGSRQGILRRLHLLFHDGYLDRPPEQILPYRQGSDPMVYGLGNKGADFLSQEYKIPRGKVDWTSKNREVKTVFLKHALMVAHFMVALEAACRKHKAIRIIEPEEILVPLPGERKKQPNPFSWKVQTKREVNGAVRNLHFSMVPDKVFGLHLLNEPAGKNKTFFFLEADRATMPVKRAHFFKTSFYKKMLGYWESWREDLFKKTFGFKNARVLTITTSQERIKSMIAAGKDVDDRGKGSRMFLFSQANRFTPADAEKIFRREWQNGRDGELVSLVD